MKFKAVLALVPVLLAAAFLGGFATQEARAQSSYLLIVDDLQTSALVGHDITIAGIVEIFLDTDQLDLITVTLASPDPLVVTQIVNIPIELFHTEGQQLPFVIGSVTFVRGEFLLGVSSDLEGTLLTESYSVPNYDLSVGISATTGQVGTQFIVSTSFDVGNMTIVQTRFDITYVLNGVPSVQSEFVLLYSSFFYELVGISDNPDYHTWTGTRAFNLNPGTHTLEVRVTDQSISEEVLVTSFTITVTDQIEALDTRLDETRTDLQQQLDDLGGRTENVEAISAATALSSVLAFLAIAAIVLSVITLLIQFGILKLGRQARRGPGEGEE